MQNFPILNSKQVALMRADTYKGYVLDESFAVAINDEQIVYTVFNNHEDALKVANEIINTRVNIECVIYDSKQVVLSFIRPIIAS